MSDDMSIPTQPYRASRRTRGMDPGTRRLAAIAVTLGGALMVLIGAWSLFGHRSGGEVPVVQADPHPVRVKPQDPGGLQVAGAGNEIFSGGSDTDVQKLAPPPETPDPQALKAPPPPPKTVTPATALGPAHTPAAAASASARTPAAASAAATTPSNPPATPAQTAKPAQPAPTPAPAASAEKAAPAAHASGKSAAVQLAALSSEEAAKTEWQRLTKRMPDLFSSRQPQFSHFEHDGKSFWRVRTGGFADSAQAVAFCDRVKAKGAGCTVADF